MKAISRPAVRAALMGFTLIEMLVVLGIIAAVLAVALPNWRGQRESSLMETAARQLIADLSSARARAINHRTTVAMLFMSSDILVVRPAGYTDAEWQQILRLRGGVYTQYALYAGRRVGDQPGRGTPRYLTEWKTVPDGSFIAPEKFVAMTDVGLPQFAYADFPFPLDISARTLTLPYVAFDYEGRLCEADGSPLRRSENIRIPLARGAILYSRSATGDVTGFTVQEVPPNNSVNIPNHVVIDWLTGRAHYERPEIQSIP